MAISTTDITVATPVTIYVSSGESAVTFMSFCNYGNSTIQLDIHVVVNGDIPSTSNMLASGLNIDAGDTYIFYKGGEKLILSNNDSISINSTIANSLSAITSYTGL